MTDLCLTVGEEQSILESLDVNKATGPDGVPARLLKETASVISVYVVQQVVKHRDGTTAVERG